MSNRILQSAVLLAATLNLSYVAASCVPPANGQTPLDVLKCLQSELDSQQKRIAELEKENERLRQLTDAISVSSGGNVGTTNPGTKLDIPVSAGSIKARQFMADTLCGAMNKLSDYGRAYAVTSRQTCNTFCSGVEDGYCVGLIMITPGGVHTTGASCTSSVHSSYFGASVDYTQVFCCCR
jgi:hypothetical protein